MIEAETPGTIAAREAGHDAMQREHAHALHAIDVWEKEIREAAAALREFRDDGFEDDIHFDILDVIDRLSR